MKYLATIAIFCVASIIFSMISPSTTVVQWMTLMIASMCLQVLMNKGQRND